MFKRAGAAAFLTGLVYELGNSWASALIPGYADGHGPTIFLLVVPVAAMFAVGYRTVTREDVPVNSDLDDQILADGLGRRLLATVTVAGVSGNGVGRLLAIAAGWREQIPAVGLGLVSVLNGMSVVGGTVAGVLLAYVVGDYRLQHRWIFRLGAYLWLAGAVIGSMSAELDETADSDPVFFLGVGLFSLCVWLVSGQQPQTHEE